MAINNNGDIFIDNLDGASEAGAPNLTQQIEGQQMMQLLQQQMAAMQQMLQTML